MSRLCVIRIKEWPLDDKLPTIRAMYCCFSKLLNRCQYTQSFLFYFFVLNIYLLFVLNFYYIVITLLGCTLHCLFCKCFCIALYSLFSLNSLRSFLAPLYSYFTLHMQLCRGGHVLFSVAVCIATSVPMHNYSIIYLLTLKHTWACCPQYDKQRKLLVQWLDPSCYWG